MVEDSSGSQWQPTLKARAGDSTIGRVRIDSKVSVPYPVGMARWLRATVSHRTRSILIGAGTLAALLSCPAFPTAASAEDAALDEGYRSLVDLSTRIYPHAKICADMAELSRRFPGRARLEPVGKSVWGREILALVLGEAGVQPRRRILIIGNMHAREVHSAPMMVKQVELYLHNWDRTFKGRRIGHLLSGSALYYIPTTNPDGNEIVYDGIRCMEADTDVWEGRCIPATVPDRPAAMGRIRRMIAASAIQVKQQYGRNIDPYTFSGKDLVIYKANASGVDLHYNFHEPGINGEYVLGQRKNPRCAFAATAPATQGFVGERGIDQPETIAVRDFIARHGLREFSVTYHGRFPKIFYDYTVKWGPDAPLEKRALFKEIAVELAALSGSPLNGGASGPVGFCGWFQQRYHGLSFNIETGHEVFNGKPAYCPLPAEQLPVIWGAQKLVPLQLILSIGG